MDIVQIIGSLGFPIVACIFLFKQNIEIMNRHADETKSLMEGLNNNTLALQHLTDVLATKVEDSEDVK